MIDPLEEMDEGADDTLDDEMPTSHLPSNVLRPDWAMSTHRLPDEVPASPRPSGMGPHAASARIAPTPGARIVSGMRRGTAIVVFAGLVIALVAAGAYALISTPWLAGLTAQGPTAAHPPLPTTHAVGASQPASKPAPAPRATAAAALPSTQGSAPAAGATPLVASIATQLRDRGIAAYKAGDYAGAITSLEASIARGGGDAVSYFQLGLSYMASTGRPHALDDAELAFRSAMSEEPTWAGPQQMLAETLLRRGFYKEAEDPALSATRLDPNSAEAWMTLGRVYQGEARDAEATRAFAEAIRLSPPPPSGP